MRLLFTVLVWLVAAAHFAFLIYLPVGGFLALRHRRTIWLHVAAVAWAAGSVTVHLWCPLTALDRHHLASKVGAYEVGPLPGTGVVEGSHADDVEA